MKALTIKIKIILTRIMPWLHAKLTAYGASQAKPEAATAKPTAKDDIEAAIAAELQSPDKRTQKAIAEAYGVSKSKVYTINRKLREAKAQAQADADDPDYVTLGEDDDTDWGEGEGIEAILAKVESKPKRKRTAKPSRKRTARRPKRALPKPSGKQRATVTRKAAFAQPEAQPEPEAPCKRGRWKLKPNPKAQAQREAWLARREAKAQA